ncbi:MAG: hypothetical protein WKG07_01960 [Hymenobacter sp.]
MLSGLLPYVLPLFYFFFCCDFMARDTELIAKRNVKIYAAYNRLTAEEVPCSISGQKVFIRLSYQQIMNALGAMFFLSARSVEPIITAMTPRKADIKTSGPART